MLKFKLRLDKYIDLQKKAVADQTVEGDKT